MSRSFIYARVSTSEQTVENQIQEIANAGFAVQENRIVCETVSGATAIAQRPGFAGLLNRLESGDVLIVTKLDRLGRNAIDVAATVARMGDLGIRVHCLALGGMDLTSPAGTMTMNVINAVAQFERDILIERTMSGLKRARKQGKRLGRPSNLSASQRQAAITDIASGVSASDIARKYGVSRQTIWRLKAIITADNFVARSEA